MRKYNLKQTSSNCSMREVAALLAACSSRTKKYWGSIMNCREHSRTYWTMSRRVRFWAWTISVKGKQKCFSWPPNTDWLLDSKMMQSVFGMMQKVKSLIQWENWEDSFKRRACQFKIKQSNQWIWSKTSQAWTRKIIKICWPNSKMTYYPWKGIQKTIQNPFSKFNSQSRLKRKPLKRINKLPKWIFNIWLMLWLPRMKFWMEGRTWSLMLIRESERVILLRKWIMEVQEIVSCRCRTSKSWVPLRRGWGHIKRVLWIGQVQKVLIPNKRQSHPNLGCKVQLAQEWEENHPLLEPAVSHHQSDPKNMFTIETQRFQTQNGTQTSEKLEIDFKLMNLLSIVFFKIIWKKNNK